MLWWRHIRAGAVKFPKGWLGILPLRQKIHHFFFPIHGVLASNICLSMYVVTPILEGLRPPQNLQNRRFCVLYAKIPNSEVLRPPQKLQNRRFCVVLKILEVIFNTPKSEFLRTIRKNSKIGGFAPTAKTQKSEVLRSFKNTSGMPALRAGPARCVGLYRDFTVTCIQT